MQAKTLVLNSLRQVFFLPPVEKALTWFTQGKHHTKSFWAKIPPNNYQYPKNSERVVVRREIKYLLDLHDMVDWYTYYDFQVPAMDALFRLVEEGQTFVDVGANMGGVTFEAAKRVGLKGKVISFEPVSQNMRRLKKNLALNFFPQVTLVQKALSNCSGKWEMFTSRDDNGGMYKLAAKAADPADAVTVEVSTFDEEIRRLSPEKIDIIKIDVEGNEEKVIEGALGSIVKYKPILFVEVAKADLLNNGSSPQSLIQLIQSLGYEVFDSETNEIITPQSHFGFMMDVLALPKQS